MSELNDDDAHTLSRQLAAHHRTTGMAASMGVTCVCGFHEMRSLVRASGSDGLDVHRAEVAMRTVTPPERLILTDLIAELRDDRLVYTNCDAREAADRAEQRLKEVTDE